MNIIEAIVSAANNKENLSEKRVELKTDIEFFTTLTSVFEKAILDIETALAKTQGYESVINDLITDLELKKTGFNGKKRALEINLKRIESEINDNNDNKEVH